MNAYLSSVRETMRDMKPDDPRFHVLGETVAGINALLSQLTGRMNDVGQAIIKGNGAVAALAEANQQATVPTKSLEDRLAELTSILQSGNSTYKERTQAEREYVQITRDATTMTDLLSGSAAEQAAILRKSKDERADANRAFLSTSAAEREQYFSVGTALRLAAQASGGYVTQQQAETIASTLAARAGIDKAQALEQVQAIATQTNASILQMAEVNENLGSVLNQVRNQLVAQAEATGGIVSTEKTLELQKRLTTEANIEESQAFQLVNSVAAQQGIALERNIQNERDLLNVVREARQEGRLFNFAILELVRGFEGVTNSVLAFSGSTDAGKEKIRSYGQALQEAVGAGLGLKFGLEFLGGSFEKFAGPIGVVVGALTLIGSAIEHDNEAFKKLVGEGLKQFEDGLKFLSEPERFQLAKNLEAEIDKVDKILVGIQKPRGVALNLDVEGMTGMMQAISTMTKEQLDLTERQQKSLDLLRSKLTDELVQQKAINIMHQQTQTLLETTGSRFGQIVSEQTRLNTELATGLTYDQSRELSAEELSMRKTQLNLLEKEHAELTKSVADKQMELVAFTEKRFTLGQATTTELTKQIEASISLARSDKSRDESLRAMYESENQSLIQAGVSSDVRRAILEKIASLNVGIREEVMRILDGETSLNKVTDSTRSLLEKKVALGIATTGDLKIQLETELASERSKKTTTELTARELELMSSITELEKKQAEASKTIEQEKSSLEISGITNTFDKRREESRRTFEQEMQSLGTFYETDLVKTNSSEESRRHVEERMAEIRRQFGDRNTQIEFDQTTELDKLRVANIQNESQRKLAAIQVERNSLDEQFRVGAIKQEEFDAKRAQLDIQDRDTRFKTEDDIARLKIEALTTTDDLGKRNYDKEIERIRAERDFELQLIQRNRELGIIPSDQERDLRVNIVLDKAGLEEARVELERMHDVTEVVSGGFSAMNSFIGSELARSMGQARSAFDAFAQGAVQALARVIEKLVEAAIEAAILRAILSIFGLGAAPLPISPATFTGFAAGPTGLAEGGTIGGLSEAAHGTTVDEPVVGRGVRTGRTVFLGEAGVEHVVPDRTYKQLQERAQMGGAVRMAEGGIIGAAPNWPAIQLALAPPVFPEAARSPFATKEAVATMAGQPQEMTHHVVLSGKLESELRGDHIYHVVKVESLVAMKAGERLFRGNL